MYPKMMVKEGWHQRARSKREEDQLRAQGYKLDEAAVQVFTQPEPEVSKGRFGSGR